MPVDHSGGGGSVTLHLEEWKKLTKDTWALNIVQNGYLLIFKSPPPLIPPREKSLQDHYFLKSEVNVLLRKGAIEKVPIPQRNQVIYSRYFLMQKR